MHPPWVPAKRSGSDHLSGSSPSSAAEYYSPSRNHGSNERWPILHARSRPSSQEIGRLASDSLPAASAAALVALASSNICLALPANSALLPLTDENKLNRSPSTHAAESESSKQASILSSSPERKKTETFELQQRALTTSFKNKPSKFAAKVPDRLGEFLRRAHSNNDLGDFLQSKAECLTGEVDEPQRKKKKTTDAKPRALEDLQKSASSPAAAVRPAAIISERPQFHMSACWCLVAAQGAPPPPFDTLARCIAACSRALASRSKRSAPQSQSSPTARSDAAQRSAEQIGPRTCSISRTAISSLGTNCTDATIPHDVT